MTNRPLHESGRPSCIINRISVRGALRKDWQDWFNGMLITAEGLSKGSTTTFTCKVRDQAALVGIINWHHDMNLLLEEVNLYSEEGMKDL